MLDGTDTFPSRYLASDVCVWLKKPLVSGSVMRFEGQVAVFDARRGPCYRCLFPEPPPPELAPNCAEAGVLGVLPGRDRRAAGDRGAEAPARRGRAADRAAARLRRARHGVPDVPHSEGSRRARCAASGRRSPRRSTTPRSARRAPARRRACRRSRPRELRARLDAGGDLLAARRARALRGGAREHRRRAADPARPARGAARRARAVARRATSSSTASTGGRSRRACELLRSKGFARVANLAGGIEAWAREVDPEVKPVLSAGEGKVRECRRCAVRCFEGCPRSSRRK